MSASEIFLGDYINFDYWYLLLWTSQLVCSNDFGSSPLITSQPNRAALLPLLRQLCNQIPHQVHLYRLVRHGLTFREYYVISFQFCTSWFITWSCHLFQHTISTRIFKVRSIKWRSCFFLVINSRLPLHPELVDSLIGSRCYYCFLTSSLNVLFFCLIRNLPQSLASATHVSLW